jgi:predicted DNA-binding transcriptional regulator AlpA
VRKLQTVKDLAKLFQKHENTIYRWIVEDHLFPNAFRVKDGWYVPESDVERLMRAGKVESNGGGAGGKVGEKPPRAGFVKGWRE